MHLMTFCVAGPIKSVQVSWQDIMYLIMAACFLCKKMMHYRCGDLPVLYTVRQYGVCSHVHCKLCSRVL